MGEWGAIDRLLPLLDSNALATNDDAVAVKMGQGNRYVICNTDFLVWETDVPKEMTPRQAGKKLVTMTISDIVAKGGKPVFFLSGSLFPPSTNMKEFMEIARGIKGACKEYGAKFLGGDLGEGEKSINGVGVGFGRQPVSRSGTKPGDSVWATGKFGTTGAAFHYLFSEGEKIDQMDALLQSVLEPRIDPSIHVIIEKIATASIDSSDGLSISLHEIAKESGVKINVEHLPISEIAKRYAERNALNIEELSLFSGEEFEIIFTTSLPQRKVKSFFQRMDLDTPSLIGTIEEGEGVRYGGERIPRKGWEHFKE